MFSRRIGRTWCFDFCTLIFDLCALGLIGWVFESESRSTKGKVQSAKHQEQSTIWSVDTLFTDRIIPRILW